MSLITFVWIAPLLSVIFFSLIEHGKSKSSHNFTARFSTIFGLIFITYIVNLTLSTYGVTPLVSIVPAQVFNLSAIEMSPMLNIMLCVLVIDFFQYCLHRLHHAVPFLWRLHRVHHSDKQVDAMTSFLHHPIELVTGFALLISLYIFFGVPFMAIIIYGLLQSLHVGFAHLNILIPQKIDRYLRFFIVTPNTHRIHHSLDKKEADVNFGEVFIFWDYLFNTHRYKPNEAVQLLETGIDAQQSPSSLKLWPLLRNPFQ